MPILVHNNKLHAFHLDGQHNLIKLDVLILKVAGAWFYDNLKLGGMTNSSNHLSGFLLVSLAFHVNGMDLLDQRDFFNIIKDICLVFVISSSTHVSSSMYLRISTRYSTCSSSTLLSYVISLVRCCRSISSLCSMSCALVAWINHQTTCTRFVLPWREASHSLLESGLSLA